MTKPSSPTSGNESEDSDQDTTQAASSASSHHLGVWQPTLTREGAQKAAAAMGLSVDQLTALLHTDE